MTGFSFFDTNILFYASCDCQIIAAALFADCETLYTEDLQDGQIIDRTLKIVNPFKTENI
jgi:predicted nucleic acid-binding protein